MSHGHDSKVYAVIFLIVVALATALAVFRPAERGEATVPTAEGVEGGSSPSGAEPPPQRSER